MYCHHLYKGINVDSERMNSILSMSLSCVLYVTFHSENKKEMDGTMVCG